MTPVDNSSAVDESRHWATPLAGAVALVGAGIALIIAAGASYAEPGALVVVGIAGALVIVAGVFALVRRPRLTLTTTDQPTLTVRGIRGAHTYRADQIELIEVLATRRLLGRSTQLIAEFTDERIVVFSRWDLGESPRAVAETLADAGIPVSGRR